MRIFYPLLCYYPSQGGGPANSLYWLNKALGERGFKSVIISTQYGLKSEDIDLALFQEYNIDVEFVKSSKSFFSVDRIRRALSVDVLHFSSLFFLPTVFFVYLGLLFDKKILISPRGELYASALSRKSFFKLFYLRFLKIVQRQINFHATNNYEKELILEYFPFAKSITVLPNYIEIPEKVQCDKLNQILFLGRINSIKNIDLLISAFSSIPHEIVKDFKLVIAGDGKLKYELDYLTKLDQLIVDLEVEDRVILLGAKHGKDKELLFSSSYCTVLPSKSENFGNVVLESLCQGTPVIVSKKAPWAMVEEHKAGYWIEPTIEGIKDALTKILTMGQGQYAVVQNNAIQLAHNYFDIEKNADKWIFLYESL